jgi:alpha-tubulin suppressor-like RCC1 family protein
MRSLVALPAAAGVTLATLWASGGLGGCAVRLPPDRGAADGEEAQGTPCNAPMDCPQPKNPCLLAYCVEQQCQEFPSPQGPLPPDRQQEGDCQRAYCDGTGSVASYPAPNDRPVDDGNECTEERCVGLAAKHPPKVVGAPCDAGVCNGAGRCGVCSPEAAECRGNAVRRCRGEGQWSEPTPCESAQPVCSAARCLGILDFDLGGEHACARLEDGSVRCWGSSSRGELGSNGLGAATTPGSATELRALALGRRHACGIDASGVLWCWGAGEFGQLGHGAFQSSPSLVQVGVAGAAAAAVGDGHSCALGGDGVVQCWGRNDRGQLGRGAAPRAPLGPIEPRSPASPGRNRPTAIPGLAGVAAIELGAEASCVRVPGAPSWRCWGLRGYPQPEPPTDKKEKKKLESSCSAKPAPVAGLPPASQLELGADFGCALANDATVHCWGANSEGQLGDGTTKDRFKAAPIEGLRSVQRIALGDAFGCALVEGGTVQCWGANGRGQLGRGAASGAPSDPRPALVGNLDGVLVLRAGAEFACVRASQAPIACWGAGAAGQLGAGGSSDSPSPTPPQW